MGLPCYFVFLKWTSNVQELLSLWGLFEQILHDLSQTLYSSFKLIISSSHQFKFFVLFLTWNNLTGFSVVFVDFCGILLRLKQKLHQKIKGSEHWLGASRITWLQSSWS